MFLRREHEGNTKDVPVSQIQGQVSKSSLFGVLFSSPKKIPASKITTLRSMCDRYSSPLPTPASAVPTTGGRRHGRAGGNDHGRVDAAVGAEQHCKRRWAALSAAGRMHV